MSLDGSCFILSVDLQTGWILQVQSLIYSLSLGGILCVFDLSHARDQNVYRIQWTMKNLDHPILRSAISAVRAYQSFFCVVFCKSLFFFSFCLYSFWTLHCLSFTDLWLLITLWYLQTSLNMIYISPWTIYPSQRLIYFSFILVTNTKNITARLWKTIQCFIYVKNNTFTI